MHGFRSLSSVLVKLAVATMAPSAAVQQIEVTACVGHASRCFDAFTTDPGVANGGGLVVRLGAQQGRRPSTPWH